MSHSWLPRKKLVTALRMGGILVSVGICSVMMTSSAMAAGVVTEGDHDSTAKTHRPKCEGDVLPVDFSVRIYDITLNVASTDSKAYVDYKTETIWKRCADNGALRQSTRAYAVFGAKYCQLSGWYGTQVNGVHKNAFDCVKYIGLPPDDYKAGSALACEKPPSPYGTSNADCLTRPYGALIAKEDNQPNTIADPTISSFKGEVDSDGDSVGDGFYVPNWQNAKKNSGSKTFSLGTMCQYFKYGNGFDKTTNDRTSWRRCIDAKITVKWRVTPPTQPSAFSPRVIIDPDVVEPVDEDPYEVNGDITYQEFNTIDGEPKPQVPVVLHKAIYEPGRSPFRGGTNTAGPNAGYYDSPRVLTQLGSPYSLANMTSNYTINPPIIEPFDPAYRAQNGSTICYILAVQQPPTVKTHTYNYRTQTGTDAEGDPIYSEERSATERFYSDENHDHRNNFPNPSSGGINYRAEQRTWRHAVDCVVVGKRPKVQILGSDLRVRGKTETKVSRYSGQYFGSWVEYAALTKGTDSAPASGAGYRSGTASPPTARGDWSKLTFANTPDYGGFSTLPSAPDIANHYKQQTNGKAAYPGTLGTGGMYRNSGSVDIDESTGLTKTTILYSEGTVTIRGNIAYSEGSFTSLDDIPQVIIVAKNINIVDTVTRVDAWLVAYDTSSNKSEGNINTCSNGPVVDMRWTGACSNKLTINGPIIADGLYLNRTGPLVGSPAEAAEELRLRPDAYLWAQARQRSTGAARTVDIVELPPRF